MDALELARSRTYPVGVARAFDTVLPHPLTGLFSRRYAALPPIREVREVRDQDGEWGSAGVGQTRTIVLADRIFVMRPRPGRIFEEIDADLPRPRDRQSAAFDFIKRRVLAARAPGRQTGRRSRGTGSACRSPATTPEIPEGTPDSGNEPWWT